MDVNTIGFGDASRSMICVAIYARVMRKNGQYSCQLILSRIRTVPKEMSLPRAELLAALINTYTGEIVKRSLQQYHCSALKLTDNQVALYWIDSHDKLLKQWVRNRVIEIRRFTQKQQWYYIHTSNMIADIGTRKGASISDVDSSSVWINGHDWMRLNVTEFPIMSAENLRLNEVQVSEASKEFNLQAHHTDKLPDEIMERYQFSNYIIDPNYRNFSCVTRILGYVIKFCNKLLKRKNQLNSQTLNDEDILAAETYFYRKASSEVVHFLQPKKYEPISTMKNGILTYKTYSA